jgi:hypothetical protein
MIKWWPQRYYFSSRNKLFTETRNKLIFCLLFIGSRVCVCVCWFQNKNCNIWKGGGGVGACWSGRTSKNKSAICSIDCQLCHVKEERKIVNGCCCCCCSSEFQEPQ